MSIQSNLEKVKKEIDDACIACGRNPESVRLIAVSKTVPPEAVMEAYVCGQRVFGENKVQELESKFSLIPNGIEWHLIGHLQGNKAAKAVRIAEYIHSVDSESLLMRIDRLAGEINKRVKILLEVNISNEESKFGLKLNELDKCAEAASQCRNIEFKGLMTMAPFEADEKKLTTIFLSLKNERDRLERALSIKLPELSMGMSSDFRVAIACGATMVRIGTSIFGERYMSVNSTVCTAH